MAQSDEHNMPLSSSEMLGSIGFAGFFAWYLFVFFGAFAYFPDSVPEQTRLGLQAFGFVLIAVLSSVLHKHAIRIVDMNCKVPFLCLVCACGSMFPLQFLVAGSFPYPAALAALCSVPAAFCALVFLISWEDACGRIRSCHCLRYLCVSLGGGAVVYLLLRSFCQGASGWLFAFLLLWFSACALHSVQDAYDTGKAIIVDAPDRPGLDRRIALLGFTVNCALGLAWGTVATVAR